MACCARLVDLGRLSRSLRSPILLMACLRTLGSLTSACNLCHSGRSSTMCDSRTRMGFNLYDLLV
ncbi:hypothetical protein GOP47_0002691 [Adiantum capillus-veneris]|uniref:Uncharacterized protein n=1 Tax=Adiantum capillus-veneris TaxID=13818 RepID=A0A9D4VB18_ADICA|nr:hypothetical protein GOP47_0002691 [Adiantum capillus-veneris]